MVSPQTNGCPEPEVLAAYVDRGLSLSERARVEGHLASCPQCVALVAGVARTVAELSALGPDVGVGAEATPLVTRRAAGSALAAAAAVIAVLAAPALVQPWLGRDSGLVSLVGNVGEQRSVLGRLTGGFPHSPLGAPSAGGQDGRAAGSDRVQLTAGKIRESFGDRATPSQMHAVGVAQLLAGRYDDAAQSLLAASREQPLNARYLSDVAAVQLERARLGLRPDDLPRALAAADRARRLDSSLKEAWFNRALAASALSLTAEARAAWTEYLQRDSASPWATEARSRLDELSRPSRAEAWRELEGRLQSSVDASSGDEAVRLQTTEARNLIEGDWLVRWATAVLNGHGGQAELELERVRVMSQAMQRVAGDSLYVDAVSTIDRASVSGGLQLRQLAEAHRDYAAAAALFNDDRFAAAAPAFAAAQSRFGSSPFAILAALHQGAIGYVTGRASEATSILEGTLGAARSKGYAYAAGRSTWFLGLIAIGQSRFGEAQAQYEETLETFLRMGDVEQSGAAHSLLAALYDYLGDASSAWKHRSIAFESLTASRSAKFKYQVLASAVPAIRAESPETALSVQDAAIAAAREGHRDSAIGDGLATRAAILAGLNRAGEAAASLLEARQHLARVDQAFRSRLEVNLLSTESDLSRLFDPAASVAAASRAIEVVEQRRDRLRLAQLQLRLARAYLEWGRTDAARAALDRGLIAFNEEQAASTEQRPISALDESWQLFDASIQLSLKERNYERAFALADAARARSVSESRKFGATSLAAVQAALSQDEAILAVNQFDDELAVWVIQARSVNVTMRPISRQTAQQLIARQQHDIWTASATTAAGRDLYNEIVRPISQRLSGIARLIVVPDDTFRDASFAAFYNPLSGRFLVEELTVRMSPSAAAFAMASTAAARGDSTEPLVFNGPDTPNAAAVAAAYATSEVLAGPNATPRQFFSNAAGRRVVHIGARTAANASFPLLSRLVAADEPGLRHSGAILGSEIAERTLPNTGLVVIDEAGGPSSNRGEGTSSLARAFLAAGVPAVVGTLPGADEDAARDLMIGFHRELANGVPAEQALSRVQRNAIEQNGRRLGAWSALVLYGADR